MLITSARLKLLGGTVLTLLILTTFCGIVPATIRAAAPATNDWQDTGLTLPDDFSRNLTSLNFCFDATYPGLLYVNGSAGGAMAYDWQNNKELLQFAYNFTLCDERTGQLYGPQGSGAVRFNLSHQEGQYIQYMPDVLAQDGTGAAYAITRDSNHNTFDDNRLYFSPDSGQTWIDRGLPFRGKRIVSVTVVPAYAGAIYAAVLEKSIPSTPSLSGKSTYGIYFSTDGGQNWEKRSEHISGDRSVVSLNANLSPSVPVSTLVLTDFTQNQSLSGHIPDVTISWLSSDGGKTFPTELRRITSGGEEYRDSGQVYYTPTHLVRINLIGNNLPPPQITLETSTNNGAYWQDFSVPYAPPILSWLDQRIRTELVQVSYAPNSFFLHNTDGTGNLWYSVDGVSSWQKLTHNIGHILVTPYAPLTLIGFDKGKIYRLSVPQADASLTSSVADSGVPNNIYFPETGHNLPGLFKNYWEQHGGLAQFGFPRTEPFLEVNPSDGRIYSVQYFERNRFEYHPEYAGTPYEVELGLLGNQLTESRRNAGEAPFQRADDKQDPDNSYFNETGHNLQGVFKSYWEQHGGLSRSVRFLMR